MRAVRNGATGAVMLVLTLATTATAADKKEFKYTVGPGATVTVVNEFGPVTVKGASGRQVVIVATMHSDKVQVNSSQAGNRVVARTYAPQRTSEEEGRVEYEVLVPQDASVTVRSATGPIRAERLRGDVMLEGDAATVEVREVSNAHVHVRTVNGPITLTNISKGHVEITSVGGNVQLTSVSGPKVTVNTTKGTIHYSGNFGDGGDYLLNNHSGDIEVLLPTTASVDITAQSIKGSVEQDFPLREKQHTSFVPSPGRSFAGTLHDGASSVRLRSFSGKIRVKKQ
ncbi:MAG TPA: DUF4097 family beta strand repeat-containing protein [Terriglobales bacterium]|jgi:DUF4097 and DUF4098 domain-containing protein YvlB|nr:DUF4097 family beta strand repeat-containing protein [Terriglobales bacterium]